MLAKPTESTLPVFLINNNVDAENVDMKRYILFRACIHMSSLNIKRCYSDDFDAVAVADAADCHYCILAYSQRITNAGWTIKLNIIYSRKQLMHVCRWDRQVVFRSSLQSFVAYWQATAFSSSSSSTAYTFERHDYASTTSLIFSLLYLYRLQTVAWRK